SSSYRLDMAACLDRSDPESNICSRRKPNVLPASDTRQDRIRRPGDSSYPPLPVDTTDEEGGRMPSTSRRRLVVLGEAEDSGSVGSRMFGRVALAGRRVHTHLATLTIEVDAAADLGPSHLGLLLGVHAPGMGSTGTTHDPVAE